MPEIRLTVSFSPHLRHKVSVEYLMYSVVIALIPALIGSVYFFGIRALIIIILSVISSLFFEAVGQKLFGRRVSITDGSALITGLLLAFNLPPGVPYFIPVIGSAFAVIIAKQFFGGLGYNFINPALAARAFLVVSWPHLMTKSFLPPRFGTLSGIQALTQATPLTILKDTRVLEPEKYPKIVSLLSSSGVIKNLFFGQVGGCLGETSAFLLLVGGIFLLLTRVIDWRIPLSYLGTVLLISLFTPLSPLFHLFSGGLMLGAFFMATDYVTIPITSKGRVIFGIGCGILTMLIRLFGGYPEGVCYSILFMNILTPLIERWTHPRIYGH
uniref:Ion-translocating oxidoreductase complex subunit D n=1 Tax=candidate division WOR-3 bacterium TaxID=2052148 RepID=A0A7C3YT02_UNCW3